MAEWLELVTLSWALNKHLTIKGTATLVMTIQKSQELTLKYHFWGLATVN